jgi:TBC1 domain family member 15
MVEIRRLDAPDPGEPRNKAAEDDDKYRLVYSKSKVYVNPTAYARDNIPGFVALVKRVSPRIMATIVHLTDLHLGNV